MTEGKMDTHLLGYISDLAARNKGQMTFNEYGEIAERIMRKPGCRLLVFGCGNDSPLWLKANESGRTLFVEHSATWAMRAEKMAERESLPRPDIRLVKYKTRLDGWAADLLECGKLFMSDIDSIGMDWDVTIVDGPTGCGRNSHGRLQSIYESAKRCASGGVVFVHDIKRQVERAAADALLVARGFKERRITSNMSGFERP